jgi:SEC-C motif domain protein
MTTAAELCPCGSGRAYDGCCGPAIAGTTPAPTAEALMRSRYTAYAKGAIDYLVASHHATTRAAVDREGIAEWAQRSTWLGLEIGATEAGAATDERGTVEFRAKYRQGDIVHTHHERSQFLRADGRWFYVDGKVLKPPPVVRAADRVGRNDPCPCGSGKKYKRCHGG